MARHVRCITCVYTHLRLRRSTRKEHDRTPRTRPAQRHAGTRVTRSRTLSLTLTHRRSTHSHVTPARFTTPRPRLYNGATAPHEHLHAPHRWLLALRKHACKQPRVPDRHTRDLRGVQARTPRSRVLPARCTLDLQLHARAKRHHADGIGRVAMQTLRAFRLE
jgi:hypothetical protein